ncbi:MAG: hypothetical protein ACR2MU_02260 [Gaiellaceae bacterium]
MTTRDRIAKNERLFRELNERIREVSESLLAEGEGVEFICECGNEGCLERITLTRAEFRTVRSERTHFFVIPGHELPELEQIVARHAGFTVVGKPWLSD